MDGKEREDRQIYCQGCGKKLPITISRLRGELFAKIRCKFCKQWNDIHLTETHTRESI